MTKKREFIKPNNINWSGDLSWDGEANLTKDDIFLLKEFKKLIKKHGIKKVYETGTFVGGMTKEFSKIVDEVESIEINSAIFNLASENLQEIKNIKLHLGNSPEVLQDIVEKNNNKVLFFFDAHWYDHNPIFDELNVIIDKNIEPIIVIDDFRVPEKPEWGSDHPLRYESIKEYLEKIYKNGYNYYYNKESTNNRGRIFIEPK